MTESSGTIRSVGETEAGSAGTQPARDSRPGLRPQVDAGIQPPPGRRMPRPLAACGRSSPMPQKIHPSTTKNRPAVGRISCLAELGSRPIQAEPVHLKFERSGRECGTTRNYLTANHGLGKFPSSAGSSPVGIMTGFPDLSLRTQREDLLRFGLKRSRQFCNSFSGPGLDFCRRTRAD